VKSARRERVRSVPVADFTLVRVVVLPQGAFGVLLHHDVPFCTTLERTYALPSGPGQLVKIPAGLWRCVRTRYLRGEYDTYEIEVPGHARLLFHKGNVELHSEGCVLVGESYATFAGQPGIAASEAGFVEFMNRAGNRPEFQLRVT